MDIRIGVDLGGTKIEAAALDKGGAVVARKRVPAPQGSYDATVEAVRELVLSVEAEIGQTGTLGIGIPGVISPATGLVKNCNSVWVNGKPLDRDLAAALGREVRIANDANCFALSEAIDGAGAGQPVVFGAILGTGAGGGIVVNSQVVRGRHAIGGEWGHNPLPYIRNDETDVPPCFCGKPHCLENYVAGKGLVWAYERLSGHRIPASEVPRRAQEEDEEAQLAMDHYFDRLARALSAIINILDPDAIVLGGGLSNIEAIYEEIPARLLDYVFSDVCTTPILKNHHGDSSGVRGAAWLWGK